MLHVSRGSGGGARRLCCICFETAGALRVRSAPWRGLRDAALVEASGITGASFVHAAGFIGGNATKEGVVEMAIAALAFKE